MVEIVIGNLDRDDQRIHHGTAYCIVHVRFRELEIEIEPSLFCNHGFACVQGVAGAEIPFDAQRAEFLAALNFNLLDVFFVVKKRNVLDDGVTALDVVLGNLLASEGSRNAKGRTTYSIDCVGYYLA